MEIVALEEVDSTMTEVRRRLAAGRPPGFAVVAGRQTAGRGRLRREWIAPEGNLSMTISAPWPGARADGSTVALVTGLAVHEAIRALLPQRAGIAIKWPNDILVDGGKICGILIETYGNALSVGIGLNVANRPEGVGYATSCLKDVMANPPSPGELARDVIARWEPLYAIWQAKGFGAVREEYNRWLHFVGQPTRISLDREKSVWTSGICRGVDAKGYLLLEGEDGRCIAHAAGDIEESQDSF